MLNEVNDETFLLKGDELVLRFDIGAAAGAPYDNEQRIEACPSKDGLVCSLLVEPANDDWPLKVVLGALETPLYPKKTRKRSRLDRMSQRSRTRHHGKRM